MQTVCSTTAVSAYTLPTQDFPESQLTFCKMDPATEHPHQIQMLEAHSTWQWSNLGTCFETKYPSHSFRTQIPTKSLERLLTWRERLSFFCRICRLQTSRMAKSDNSVDPCAFMAFETLSADDPVSVNPILALQLRLHIGGPYNSWPPIAVTD